MKSNAKKPKVLPKFSSIKDERTFWQKNDSAKAIDWSKAETAVFPNLSRSTKTISLRLTEDMYQRLRAAANKRDIPYQSYLKIIVAEQLKEKI